MPPEATQHDQLTALPSYKLGEKLGQGSFGSVYRALNWTTGETVAVKQIGLASIPRSELPDIMSEIDLLKNLNHTNIVQYRGYHATSSHLYIILEYCENGSLHNILKKFGRFPESLVGLYVLQVLQGLVYLHDQGVIHRDIKGSNILANKEGGIKLADFGVATRQTSLPDTSVVGSPYWMAPEVVDQSGATTSSDIWSLGALCIELLTGKPPYSFLDPMPALFRIVNDDQPPLPPGCSAAVRDFLEQCFQKDGNLRVGARKLLRHPWMMAARKQMEQQEQQRVASGTGTPRKPQRPNSTGMGYDDSVQRVQEWNAAIRPPASLHAPPPSAPTSRARLASALHAHSAAPPPTSLSSNAPPLSPKGGARGGGRRTSMPLAVAGRRRGSLKPEPAAVAAVVERIEKAREKEKEQEETEESEEREGDNWDGDFEEGISISKIAAAPNPAASTDSDCDSDDDGEGTIRPSSALSPLVTRAAPPSMSPVTEVEDYSDLLPSDDSGGGFEGRVKRLKERQQGGLLHPKDLGASPSPAPRATGAVAGGRQPLTPLRLQSAPTLGRSMSTSSLRAPTATPGGGRVLPIELYAEEEGEGEDWDEVFGGATAVVGGKKPGGRGGGDENQGRSTLQQHQKQDGGKLQLTTRLSSKSWLGDEDSDEEDPFASVADDEELTTAATTAALESDNVAREKFARLCKGVEGLIERLGGEDEWKMREASLELIAILEETPEVKQHFVKSHGMLAVIEVLQVTRSREILGVLLRVVNLIVGSDPDTLEKICLVGGLPPILSFASPKFSREIRLEAALFIGSMCRTSLLTLQMFVSCRGLKTLVEMMDENYAERKDLVWMAVDGISRVFEMNGPTPRNDFCRIFSHEGLLEPLSSALISVAQDDEDLAESAKAKIIGIFLLFAQSDKRVKEAMACRSVVLRLVKSLRMLEADLLALMLKAIAKLTQLPSALEVLQNANAIDVLIGILAQQTEGKLAAEIQNHVINSLFNLCRLSKVRQEEAAIAGAIPILQRVVSGSSPLKQFVLPILCDFAHASKTCRKLLWKHDGLNFYLTLLRDSFWANPALEAILAWLQDETARVEECLLETAAVESLLRMFCKTKSTTFESLLEPFHKLLRTSAAVSNRLATSSSFFKRIIDRLARGTAGGKAVVRLNILRITKTVFDALPLSQRDKVGKMLLNRVGRLADEDPAILVKELAKELRREFGRVRDEGKRSVQKRVIRRAASEGGGGGGSNGLAAIAGGAATASSAGRGAGVSRRGNLFGRAE